MRNVRVRSGLVTLPLALCIGVVSQEPAAKPHVTAYHPNMCGGKHLPGDELKCYVTFKGPTNVTMVSMSFNILNANAGNLVLSDTRRVTADTYEVTGAIPENVAPGTYKLAGISAILGKANRLYQFGYGLTDDLRIEVQAPPVSVEPPPIHGGNAMIGPTPAMTVGDQFTPYRYPKITDNLEIDSRSSPAGLPPSSAQESRVMINAPATVTVENFKPRPFPAITWIGGCVGTHVPGDTITCSIRFSEDTDFSIVSAGLGMDTQDQTVPYYKRPIDQRLLCSGWVAEKFRRIDARTYEVSGLLPPCASGRYYLDNVTVFQACGRELHCRGKQYYDSEIKNSPQFILRNDDQKVFPELKQVSPFPPAATISHSSSQY
jgi:hypothetical protein